jgi:8-oxo-dGTP diphosphatase
MTDKTTNIIMVAATILEKDSRYLFVQERKEKFFGLWNVPAGRSELGEAIEETAMRETKEETGYSIKLTGKVGVWEAAVIKHVFVGEIIGGDLNVPNNEIMDAQWFTLEELKAMSDKLRHIWILEVINKYEKDFKNLA